MEKIPDSFKDYKNKLPDFIDKHTGLYWTLNSKTKKIKLLNDYIIEGLKGIIKILLLDLIKAQEIILKEDFFKFKLFIQSMRDMKPGSTIFRIEVNSGNHHWIKIWGNPAKNSKGLYYGCIKNISSDVLEISHVLEKDQERQTFIENADYPVLLFNNINREMISCNTSASKLLNSIFQEKKNPQFHDIFHSNPETNLSELYEKCLIKGKWEGNLYIITQNDFKYETELQLKRLIHKDRDLLKISIYNYWKEMDSEYFSNYQDFQIKLNGLIEEGMGIIEILNILLNNQYHKPEFDSLIFINLLPKRSKNQTFAVGKPLKKLNTDSSSDYLENVIQTIKNKNEDFILTHDTMESLKPIDWAFFIPFGIRSYFTQPVYRGKSLSGLFIFCSTQINQFSKKNKEEYKVLSTFFLQSLNKAKRNKIP